jgi:hypothetical protein
VNAAWPALDWAAWRETAQHLQLMTQVVGKVRLARTPWLNHGWHVALYVTPRGLTTGPVPADGATIELAFDLIDGRLALNHSGGATRDVALGVGTVADFYRRVLDVLDQLGAPTTINSVPNEVPHPVPFPDDTAIRPWDAVAARAFHRALVSVTRVFEDYRTSFLGKASPVHFFWGSFDLAHTRFSGRPAPRHPGGVPGLPDAVTREAYSHEVASAGFWPGSDAYPHAAFYAYAYPAPDGYADAAVSSGGFDAGLGEFVLRYDEVRTSPDPEAALMAFLQSTYAAAATLGGWDRDALECGLGRARTPRAVA